MSVHRGRPEVVGASTNRRAFDPKATFGLTTAMIAFVRGPKYFFILRAGEA
jgi:hypothetical protein